MKRPRFPVRMFTNKTVDFRGLCDYILDTHREAKMEIYELVIEMKLLERRMTLYEEKYGVLSEDFYEALMSGKLERFDAYDETRTDFSRWKGLFETWRRRKETYAIKIRQLDLVETFRVQPVY